MDAYRRQNGREQLTARQMRQVMRMMDREQARLRRSAARIQAALTIRGSR